MSDLLTRIHAEAQGNFAHGLIVDYLKAERQKRLNQVASVQKDELVILQGDIRLLDKIINDLTRVSDSAKNRPQRNGAYSS